MTIFHTTNCETKIGKTIQVKSSQNMIDFILPTVKQRLANNTSEKQPTYDNSNKDWQTIQVKSSRNMTAMTTSILPTVKQRLANNTSEKQPTYDNFHSTNSKTKIDKQYK